ncbi:MAG: hypothetical protein GY719_26280 [bacterium]|nr:hypothetical protein [bacterium]
MTAEIRRRRALLAAQQWQAASVGQLRRTAAGATRADVEMALAAVCAAQRYRDAPRGQGLVATTDPLRTAGLAYLRYQQRGLRPDRGWQDIAPANTAGGFGVYQGRVVAGLAGTDDGRDWWQNLRLWPRPVERYRVRGKAAAGFLAHGRTWDAAAGERIIEAAQAGDSPREVLFGLHSLGGAGLVTAVRVAAEGIPATVVMFGTPPGLDRSARNSLAKAIPSHRVLLVRTAADPVPRLPVVSWIWEHPHGRVLTAYDDPLAGPKLAESEDTYRTLRRKALGRRWRRWTSATRWGPHALLGSYWRAIMGADR